MDVTQGLQIGAGTVGGGALTLWFAKAMLTRLLKQNDDLHASHNLKLDYLRGMLEQINTKMAAMEVRAAEIVGMRDDVRAMTGKLAVVEASVDRTKTDLNSAWALLKKRRVIGGE